MANEKGKGRTESIAIWKCGVINDCAEKDKFVWNDEPKRVTAS